MFTFWRIIWIYTLHKCLDDIVREPWKGTEQRKENEIFGRGNGTDSVR